MRPEREKKILNFSPGGKVRMINSIKKYKHRDLKIIENWQFRGQRTLAICGGENLFNGGEKLLRNTK